MKLIDFLREFKYVEPRDEAHYRELMKALQDIQNDPKAYAQVGKLNFMKRKAALDAWADKNLPKSEDGVQPTDMKRMGAMGKTLYVHKNGKTIMIPAEREKDFIQKGFQRSALRTEDQVDERMPASIIKHKEKLAYMSDKELADRFKDKDDNTLRQMAWRHGYGKMSDYYVNRKNKGMSQDTNEGEMRLDKTAFVQMLADKIKEPQKGHGRPEYDNRLLAKMYELITGKDVDFEGDKFTITMNKPTTEAPDNSDIDIRKLLVDISSMKDRIAELAISDDAKTSVLTALGRVEDDIAQEIKGSFPEEESYEPFPEEDEMTFEDDDAFYEAFGELGFPEDENELFDAEYRGRKVPLNKPMRGDVKKFKVYVKDPKSGNVKKVNFGHGGSSARKAGQKTMKIRKSNPKARKSFRARHNCANPGPKTKARYWSCRKW